MDHVVYQSFVGEYRGPLFPKDLDYESDDEDDPFVLMTDISSLTRNYTETPKVVESIPGFPNPDDYETYGEFEEAVVGWYNSTDKTISETNTVLATKMSSITYFPNFSKAVQSKTGSEPATDLTQNTRISTSSVEQKHSLAPRIPRDGTTELSVTNTKLGTSSKVDDARISRAILSILNDPDTVFDRKDGDGEQEESESESEGSWDSEEFKQPVVYEEDPWGQVLLPPEPDPTHYKSFDQFHKAYKHWVRGIVKSEVPLPPHPRQLSQLTNIKESLDFEQIESFVTQEERVLQKFVEHKVEERLIDRVLSPWAEYIKSVRARPPRPKETGNKVCGDVGDVSPRVVEKMRYEIVTASPAPKVINGDFCSYLQGHGPISKGATLNSCGILIDHNPSIVRNTSFQASKDVMLEYSVPEYDLREPPAIYTATPDQIKRYRQRIRSIDQSNWREESLLMYWANPSEMLNAEKSFRKTSAKILNSISKRRGAALTIVDLKALVFSQSSIDGYAEFLHTPVVKRPSARKRKSMNINTRSLRQSGRSTSKDVISSIKNKDPREHGKASHSFLEHLSTKIPMDLLEGFFLENLHNVKSDIIRKKLALTLYFLLKSGKWPVIANANFQASEKTINFLYVTAKYLSFLAEYHRDVYRVRPEHFDLLNAKQKRLLTLYYLQTIVSLVDNIEPVLKERKIRDIEDKGINCIKLESKIDEILKKARDGVSADDLKETLGTKFFTPEMFLSRNRERFRFSLFLLLQYVDLILRRNPNRDGVKDALATLSHLIRDKAIDTKLTHTMHGLEILGLKLRRLGLAGLFICEGGFLPESSPRVKEESEEVMQADSSYDKFELEVLKKSEKFSVRKLVGELRSIRGSLATGRERILIVLNKIAFQVCRDTDVRDDRVGEYLSSAADICVKTILDEESKPMMRRECASLLCEIVKYSLNCKVPELRMDASTVIDLIQFAVSQEVPRCAMCESVLCAVERYTVLDHSLAPAILSDKRMFKVLAKRGISAPNFVISRVCWEIALNVLFRVVVLDGERLDPGIVSILFETLLSRTSEATLSVSVLYLSYLFGTAESILGRDVFMDCDCKGKKEGKQAHQKLRAYYKFITRAAIEKRLYQRIESFVSGRLLDGVVNMEERQELFSRRTGSSDRIIPSIQKNFENMSGVFLSSIGSFIYTLKNNPQVSKMYKRIDGELSLNWVIENFKKLEILEMTKELERRKEKKKGRKKRKFPRWFRRRSRRRGD